MVDIADKPPGAVPIGRALVADPAVHAIVATKAVVHAEDLPPLETVGEGLQDAPHLAGMQPLRPAIAGQRLWFVQPGEAQPAAVDIIDTLIGIRGAYQDEAAVGETAEVMLAFPQGVIGGFVHQNQQRMPAFALGIAEADQVHIKGSGKLATDPEPQFPEASRLPRGHALVLQGRIQRGAAIGLEQLEHGHPVQAVEPVEAQPVGAELVGFDDETEGVNQQRRQGQVLVKRTVLAQRLGDFLLGGVEFLILDFQFGLINPQLFDELAQFPGFTARQSVSGGRMTAGDGPLGPFAEFSEIDGAPVH